MTRLSESHKLPSKDDNIPTTSCMNNFLRQVKLPKAYHKGQVTFTICKHSLFILCLIC